MIIKTIKKEIIDLGTKPIYTLTKPYSKGLYNVSNEEEQHIRITEGCPNGCLFCAESWENGREPIYYEIPEIIKNRVVILDMNLIYKPDCIEILDNLGQRKVNNKVIQYELQCGIDWRYMTQERASALKRDRFKNIRWAWDYAYSDVYKMYDCFRYLVNAGYNPRQLMVFIICNWKIPLYEVMAKLSTISKWNVQVSDCWFDNQVAPDIKPIHWKEEEIKSFRKECRNHGIMIRHHGIQVEWTSKQLVAPPSNQTRLEE